MNRIILIGNGFDLAHRLKTSYKDFLEDNLVRSNLQSSKLNTNLLNILLESKWGDIENLYYEYLVHKIGNIGAKLYMYNKTAFTPKFDELKKLNNDFKIIQDELEKYLTRVGNDCSLLDEIDYHIQSEIRLKDISQKYINYFVDEVDDKLNYFESKLLMENISNSNPDPNLLESDMRIYTNTFSKNDFHFNLLVDNIRKRKNGDLKFTHKELTSGNICTPCVTPDKVLFLNFNYTKTIEKYNNIYYSFKTNYIHGILNNKNNPIIFGYGDELSENYKLVENLNNNEALRNIKSIRYLETSNYRELLEFINTKPFQIFIMGHSCGNSDRTLLNTLFEHENCASIKPFYHKISPTEDNYSDIVQNISRNFTNKALMRDRVVNKTYCVPLRS